MRSKWKTSWWRNGVHYVDTFWNRSKKPLSSTALDFIEDWIWEEKHSKRTDNVFHRQKVTMFAWNLSWKVPKTRATKWECSTDHAEARGASSADTNWTETSTQSPHTWKSTCVKKRRCRRRRCRHPSHSKIAKKNTRTFQSLAHTRFASGETVNGYYLPYHNVNWWLFIHFTITS